MRVFLKNITISLAVLISACSNTIDNILFSLVPHPQEPKVRPYNIKQVEFVNSQDGTKLSGELTYPAEGEYFPAFVLISGHSGGEPPAGRDSIITGHKYFLVISHLLTIRGYAVLRYDNRGVGESKGEYTSASDNEFASDAASALKWLRDRSGIEISSSGFLGHSQGGIKSLIAADLDKPDYIVSLAGIGTETAAELVIRQNQDINKAKGVNPSVTDQQTKELSDIFEILRVSKDRIQAQDAIRKYAIDAGITSKKHIQKLADEFGSVWWFTEAHRDIKQLIRNYDGPILALYGSKDLLVSSSIEAGPTRSLLHHPQSEVFTFEGLNHLFQKAKKGIGPEEYWEIETTIEEEVIEKIDTWMSSTLNKTLQRTSR
jgi:pimeloyl-ACP methyl ester carboxylesterase